MKKSVALDLTTGSPMKQLILFSIPLSIGAVFQLLYSMVDSMVLGLYVDAQAFAAVGATGSVFALIFLAGNALSNGVTVLISQAWGARREDDVRRIMGQSVILTIFTGILLGVCSVAAAPWLMRLLRTPEEIFDQSVAYIRVVCGLYLMSAVYGTSSGILRAIGDSKTPLYFLIFCSILNIGLDLVFVIVCHWGVLGVAWATVTAQSVSAVTCTIYMWKKYPVLRCSVQDLQLDWAWIKRLGSISLPMLLQNSLLCIGTMVISSVINGFGTAVVAAYSLGGRVEQLVSVLFSQIAFSFSVYSGQNFGAKKYDRIDDGMKKAALLLGVLVMIAMIVLLSCAYPMALLFVKPEETEIIRLSMEFLHIDAWFLPALCAIWLYNSALRGMGFIRPTVISSIIELVAKIGLSIALSRWLGTLGIWLSSPIGWVLGLIPGVWFYHFSGWKRRVMEKDAE